MRNYTRVPRQGLRSARCPETGTPGAGNGPADKAGTAPRIDFTTHASAATTELITARDWLTVFQLPPYAHELNPVELVWSHLHGPWPSSRNATSRS